MTVRPEIPSARDRATAADGTFSPVWFAFLESVADNLRAIATYSATLTPVAVAANTSAEQTFTVTGLVVGDVIYLSKPTAQAGLGIVNARCSATNTLAITYVNATGAPITPTAETYGIVGIRP